MNPYLPPQAESDSAPVINTKKQGRFIAFLGVIFYTTPVIGAYMSRLAMKDFYRNWSSQNDDSAALAQGISHALHISLIAGLLGLIGVILILIALFSYKYREKWFFFSSVAIGIASCIILPVAGVVIALAISLVFLIMHRKFFTQN